MCVLPAQPAATSARCATACCSLPLGWERRTSSACAASSWALETRVWAPWPPRSAKSSAASALPLEGQWHLDRVEQAEAHRALPRGPLELCAAVANAVGHRL